MRASCRGSRLQSPPASAGVHPADTPSSAARRCQTASRPWAPRRIAESRSRPCSPRKRRPSARPPARPAQAPVQHAPLKPAHPAGRAAPPLCRPRAPYRFHSPAHTVLSPKSPSSASPASPFPDDGAGLGEYRLTPAASRRFRFEFPKNHFSSVSALSSFYAQNIS